MVLVRRAPFGVSRFFRARWSDRALFEHEPGLVVRVRVRFAEWLPGSFEADAFVDPGADCTILSYRWALSCRREAAMDRNVVGRPYPLLGEAGAVTETVSVAVGPSGWLDLPAHLPLARQDSPHPELLPEMPGY